MSPNRRGPYLLLCNCSSYSLGKSNNFNITVTKPNSISSTNIKKYVLSSKFMPRYCIKYIEKSFNIPMSVCKIVYSKNRINCFSLYAVKDTNEQTANLSLNIGLFRSVRWFSCILSGISGYWKGRVGVINMQTRHYGQLIGHMLPKKTRISKFWLELL